MPAPGKSRLRADFIAANVMSAYPRHYPTMLQDIEADVLRVTWSHQERQGWEWEVSVPVITEGPGFMDPLIEWYHRSILNFKSVRDLVPYGGHRVILPGQPTYTGGTGLGDTDLFARFPIDRQTIAAFGLKLPTGNPNALLGSGNLDAGVSLERFIPIGPSWGLTLQAAEIAQGIARQLNGTRPLTWQLGAALTWKAGKKDDWTLQWQRESSALNTGQPGEDQIHALTAVAWQHKLNSRQRLSLYFIEDFDFLNTNGVSGVGIGPDFTTGISFTTEW